MSALATIITSTSSTMATTTSITLTLLLLAAPPRVGVSAERRRRGGDNSADLYSDSGAGALSLPDVQQPASMNVSSLGEALFLLSSMYLSLVQPSKVAPRQVALHDLHQQPSVVEGGAEYSQILAAAAAQRGDAHDFLGYGVFYVSKEVVGGSLYMAAEVVDVGWWMFLIDRVAAAAAAASVQGGGGEAVLQLSVDNRTALHPDRRTIATSLVLP
ncbi:hypothetical protein C0Q70_01852 [Pomacea canaliculata]|uniref:TNF family profile domain-containing protein n=1 Tax=Pomacea canaliculata TaxID=400727 RepID=A0A2T7Q0M2_POMCA|nr:hypothetical protein C0Q70_01852 [Pomacea canaliculata]